MVDTYLEPNGNPKNDRRIRKELGIKRNPLRAFLKFLFTFLFISVLLVGNVIIFHNLYYRSFFVNGQSMYPTLNGNATYSDGTLIGQIYGSISLNGATVDYGIMDTHEATKQDIRRFDIIITKYSETDPSDKIKRVIALPGETFYFVSTSPNEATNGDFYLIPEDTGEAVLIPQNFGSEAILRQKDYSGDSIPKVTSPKTLEEDEYYVLGDNRPHSSDSSGGYIIRYSYIEGVAIALEGTTTLVCENGQACQAGRINFHWPQSLRWKDV
ncbi:MAG: signal peptidase I [Bacilli bacterium]|jgi:signal peptidase I